MSSKKLSKHNYAGWARVMDSYQKALALKGEKRSAFLDELEATDDRLFADVRALLEQEETLSKFLEEAVLTISHEMHKTVEINLQPGESISEFKIESELGRGQFGVVYLAKQERLDRRVALKVTNDIGSEARTLAQLDHENIVAVYAEERDVALDLRWIAMQWIPSISLQQIFSELRNRPPSGAAIIEILDRKLGASPSLDGAQWKARETFANLDPIEAVLELARGIVKAVDYAHHKQILHLDIKPANILLNQWTKPFLTDFSVSLDRRTQANGATMGGTWSYMPPEQEALFTSENPIENLRALDERADIYALGAVIVEFLSVVEIPPELVGILDRARQKNKDLRFRSAHELGTCIDSFLEMYRSRKRFPPPGPVSRFCDRFPLLAISLSGALPQVVACAVAITYNYLRIVTHLSSAQQSLFTTLVLWVTPAMFALASIVWIGLCAGIAPYLKKTFIATMDPEEVARVRKNLARLPLWGAATTTACWALSFILYPGIIELKTGGLTSGQLGHFGLSFFLSWCIALAYTLIFHLYIVARCLYPRYWWVRSSFTAVAQTELKGLTRWLKGCVALTLLVPNFAALILLSFRSEAVEPWVGMALHRLTISLVAMGVIGVVFNLALTQRILRVILALTRKSN
jgi:eukaryotic-like serine/threonine-protein kinase